MPPWLPFRLLPFLLVMLMAPPRVLSPYTGFEPGMTLTLSTMSWGSRSQDTTSPKGSLMRMPSRYTDRPCGVPSAGEAVKPR